MVFKSTFNTTFAEQDEVIVNYFRSITNTVPNPIAWRHSHETLLPAVWVAVKPPPLYARQVARAQSTQVRNSSYSLEPQT
eukprot:3880886-Amphidinium_carterae.1